MEVTSASRETDLESRVLTSLTAPERETIVNTSDGDDLVRIWTAQRRYMGRLRRNKSFTQVATGYIGGTEWAEFTIASREWFPDSGAKRRSNLTDEQKRASAERLAAIRNKKQEDNE